MHVSSSFLVALTLSSTVVSLPHWGSWKSKTLLRRTYGKDPSDSRAGEMTGGKMTGQGQHGTGHNQHEEEEKSPKGSPYEGEQPSTTSIEPFVDGLEASPDLNSTSSINGGDYAFTTGANAGGYGAVSSGSYKGTGGSPPLPTSVIGPYSNATMMYPYPNGTATYGASGTRSQKPCSDAPQSNAGAGGAGVSGSNAMPIYGSGSGGSGVPTSTEYLGALPSYGASGEGDSGIVPPYPMTTEASGDTASGYGGSGQYDIPTGTGNLGALPSYGASGGGDSGIVPPYPMTSEASGDTASGYGGSGQYDIPTGTGNLGALPSYGASGGGDSGMVPPYPMTSEGYPGAGGAGGNSSYGGGSPLQSGGFDNGGLGSQTSAGLGSVESGSYGSGLGTSGSGSGEGTVPDCPAIEAPSVTTITETISVTITVSSDNSFETGGNGGEAVPTYRNENPFPSYGIGTIGTIGTGTGSLSIPTGGPYSNMTTPTRSAAGGGASAGILAPWEDYGSSAAGTSDEAGMPELEGMASASGMVGFE
ncbi:MAG: hypothetical protein Q9208_006193 [Pyrenodesmia sp. 3 TL-2023]